MKGMNVNDSCKQAVAHIKLPYFSVTWAILSVMSLFSVRLALSLDV